MKGAHKNPKLSRTARSKKARKRLGELITDVYFDIKRNSTIPNVKVFTDECSTELNKFTEFNEERERRKIEILADDYTLFPNIAKEWLKWKKKQVNSSTNKTIRLKIVENAYKDITLYDDEMNIIGHIMADRDLKTTESYRSIPMTPRLKEILLNLKREK